MVLDHGGDHASQWAAIGSIAAKIGCTAETLRSWVRQAERDRGQRPGPTTEERERIKALEREVRELRQANEILRQGVGVFCDGGARPPTQAMIAFIDDHRGGLRGRADLQGAADRPVDLSRARGERLDPAKTSARARRDRCSAWRSAVSSMRTTGCTACGRSGASPPRRRTCADLGAPDRATAEAAIATFAEKYGAEYGKAAACLVKDREALLAFYDFPAEHWDHLRTANPIESVFATVRHRTVRTKGALSQDTARLMVFKLVMAAAKAWRRLKGENQLPKVVQGVTFRDGVEVTGTPAQTAA